LTQALAEPLEALRVGMKLLAHHLWRLLGLAEHLG
jgi:hypothetical protein